MTMTQQVSASKGGAHSGVYRRCKSLPIEALDWHLEDPYAAGRLFERGGKILDVNDPMRDAISLAKGAEIGTRRRRLDPLE